jgi:hypothetical protein
MKTYAVSTLYKNSYPGFDDAIAMVDEISKKLAASGDSLYRDRVEALMNKYPEGYGLYMYEEELKND